ncbi:hypothetical protein SAMN04487788_1945 [Microbacterium testaceum StLB037]|uniref:Uncharacterized protein n=1 Tax=Microbacterium testaceum (strain StLB037) TaxID=979556 RepID=A0A1H0PQA0_MICTS|nr:hypothetical protein [Microbacterium testaceum]SDP07292.1 hypothetical protein SAMN04487788_1945 [Microbacterium testaceum StLB037]
MPATIASSVATLTPAALSNYTADQDGGSILHDILGRTEDDITLRPAGMRKGTMTLDFATDALANAARVSLGAAAVWTLTHTERTTVNMRFVVRRHGREVAGDGRYAVRVDFEEVP